MATTLQQTQQVLPEYQERFLKDLLANVYYTDPETGQVSGIASMSPLYGQPQYDAEGNLLYRTAEGGTTTDPTQASLDQHGRPIEMVVGGVPEPDIMKFTPAQQRAIELMTGRYNPETGQYEGGGIGLYQPMMEQAEATYGAGLGAYMQAAGQPVFSETGEPVYQQDAEGNIMYDAEGRPIQAMSQGLLGTTTEAYDPTSYTSYYDPFVEDVIDVTEEDIIRQGDIERNRLAAQAVQAGAFGGSRGAIAEQELERNIANRLAETGARLRSAAFTGAQQQAQQAFENQMKRGQTASQIFGQLGQGLGSLGTSQAALGESAQASAARDVNALFNVGSLQQAQQQAEYDVQRSAAIEAAYEPFQRFSYMSDIFRGVPSTSQTLSSASTPSPNPVASIFGTAMSLSRGLGGLTNTSGS